VSRISSLEVNIDTDAALARLNSVLEISLR
jgi:hypothetical protein